MNTTNFLITCSYQYLMIEQVPSLWRHVGTLSASQLDTKSHYYTIDMR